MNITVFCGAGFSAAFGHPVMNSFFRYVDDNEIVDPEERELLDSLVLEARGANSFLGSSPENLEDILSFAVMGDRLELASGGSERADMVRRILRKVYTHTRDVEGYWSRYDGLEKFLNVEFHGSQHGVSFVTTNYDINLESAIHRFSQHCDPGFEFRVYDPEKNNMSKRSHFYYSGGIPLLKLHGSVNWFANPDDSESLLVDTRMASVRGDIEQTGNKQMPKVCTRKYEGPSVPIIIPPSFLKSDLPLPIKKVWRRAASVLNKANMVVFIGYSFPPTDTEMRYFLARSLADNPGLREIVIIDPRADEIVSRLKNGEGRFGGHFRSMLTPVAYSWTDVFIDRESRSVQPLR